MNRHLGAVTLVVRDYNEAIAWFTRALGFEIVEDTDLGSGRRWVLVAPRGPDGCRLLLAKAKDARESAAIGNQSGGRVFLFLHTDDVARDHRAFAERGVSFIEEPRHEECGTVAVFGDLYGNRRDLIEVKSSR